MLEVLFARAEQGTTFLRMTVCGLILGMLLHGATHLTRKAPGLTLLWDAGAALGLAACLFPVLLESGEGLRLYGLLGLCIGLALYWLGVGRAAQAVAAHVKIKRWEKQEIPPHPENYEQTKGRCGMPGGGRETNSVRSRKPGENRERRQRKGSDAACRK